MGPNIVKMYSRLLRPMRIVVLRATFVFIFSKESPSPTKNRNRETRRNPGTASATFGMYQLSHPSHSTAKVENSSKDRRIVGRHVYTCEPIAERGSLGVLPKG